MSQQAYDAQDDVDVQADERDFGSNVELPPQMELQMRKVLDLHPTQLAVGMQQVEFKRTKLIKKKLDRKPNKLRRFLEAHPIPGVLGPGNAFYMVDHHHLAGALHRLGVESASCCTLADWSAEPSPRHFWQRMDDSGYLWRSSPSGAPLDMDGFLAVLPHNILGMVDDPYRSLAALVRGAGGFNKVRVPFSEFKWANWLRERMPGLRPATFPGGTAATATLLGGTATLASSPAGLQPPHLLLLAEVSPSGIVADPTAGGEEAPGLMPNLWEPDHPHVIAQAVCLAASPHAASLPGYVAAQGLGAEADCGRAL